MFSVPVYTTDDLCPSNLQFFKYWDKVKKRKPNLKLIAFTIANFQNKEPIYKSKEFNMWIKDHKSWVDIAVHGYDHLYPPEAERDDFEEQVEMALDFLYPYLPKKFGYRSPGFKFTVRLEPLLKRLGFYYVAYPQHIKVLETGEIIQPLINTHCCDRYEQPITEIWRDLC